MNFLIVKPAASAAVAAAVRLPQVAASLQTSTAGVRRPQPIPAASKRGQHRADQSRYQAQCRRAMSF